jgi:hypothetical protein
LPVNSLIFLAVEANTKSGGIEPRIRLVNVTNVRYRCSMRVIGDPSGVAALKALVDEHRDYLKFLIGEAQSNTDHRTAFKASDGSHWELVLHLDGGDLEVQRALEPVKK